MTETLTQTDLLSEFGRFAVNYRDKYPTATSREIASQYANIVDSADLHALLSLAAEHFIDCYTSKNPEVHSEALEIIDDGYEALMRTRIQLRSIQDSNIILHKRFGECATTDLTGINVRLSYLPRPRGNPDAVLRLTKVIRALNGYDKVRDIPRHVIEDIYLLGNTEHNVFINKTPEVNDQLIEAAKYAPGSVLRQMDPQYEHQNNVSALIATIGTWRSDSKGNLILDSFVPNPSYIPAQIIHG